MRLYVRVTASVLIVGAALVATANGSVDPQPIALTAGDSRVLTGPEVISEVVAGRKTRHRKMGQSNDQSFSSGLYEAEAGEGNIESYPVDEFMYFVRGDMVLTSSNGDVIRLGAGDSVHVPKGWKGTWATKGYTKLYAVYDGGKH